MLEDGRAVNVGIGHEYSIMKEPPPELKVFESFISSSLPKAQSMKHEKRNTGSKWWRAKRWCLAAIYHKAFQPLKTYNH
jgi:hypothetical protein